MQGATWVTLPCAQVLPTVCRGHLICSSGCRAPRASSLTYVLPHPQGPQRDLGETLGRIGSIVSPPGSLYAFPP